MGASSHPEFKNLEPVSQSVHILPRSLRFTMGSDMRAEHHA
eukprot:SAG31_NODE_34785_length_329_cov_0.904348_1_plen_40_part_10